MFSSIKFLCLLLLVAAPVLSLPFKKRDVVDPPVLAPNASTVWYVGTTQTVVWNTTGLPPYNRITNRVGRVILGHLGGGGLNLMLNNPLAQGFNITQGSVNIVVPNVPPRTDYLIVLMGDSGNTSPTFTITGGSSSTTSSSTSSSTTQTSSSSTSTSTSATTQTSSSSTSAPTSISTSTSTAAAPTTTVTSTGGGGQSASNPASPSALSTTTMATVSSTSTPSVSNTITSTLSSTIVVVQTTQPATTSTKSNGALSTHRIGASCLSVALIISGLLI